MSPLQLLIILYLTCYPHLILSQESLQINSAKVNTTNPTNNGVQLIILNENAVSVSNNTNAHYYDVNVASPEGYALKLTIDSKWGFNYPATLTINPDIDLPYTSSILIAFSVNNEKYIVTKIGTRQVLQTPVSVYPECGTDAVQDNLETISSPNTVKSLTDISTKDHPLYLLSDDNIHPNTLTFKLKNKPMSNIMTISINNTQCMYSSFSIQNQDSLDIFMGADAGNSFKLYGVDIKYSIESPTKTTFEVGSSTTEEKGVNVDETESVGITVDLRVLLQLDALLIIIGSCFCCCLLCCVGYKAKEYRLQRERDRKVAYALRMANGGPTPIPGHLGLAIAAATDQKQKNIMAMTDKEMDDADAYADDEESAEAGSDQVVSYI